MHSNATRSGLRSRHATHARPTLALVLSLLAMPAAVRGQHPTPAEEDAAQPPVVSGVGYRAYDATGNEVSIEEIVNASLGDDVLLVGEEHDDMIGHAFETQLFEEVMKEVGGPTRSGRTVVLSMEMFERDVQYVVDEYLAGLISEDHFLRSSRPWDDYEARYRPLVEAARAAGVPVVAANAPRRYVNRVSSEGPFALEALSAQALTYLPPLPYPGPSDTYRAQWNALMTAAMAGAEGESASEDEAGADEAGAGDESADEGAQAAPSSRPYAMNPNVIQAQALWDASMGHAITDALVRHVGGFVVHFAGSFHVEKGTGIPERIADYRPGTRVVTVVMTKVEDIDDWSAEEHPPLADYVVLTRKPE
jgi:uncharacterized iron-regulated protein